MTDNHNNHARPSKAQERAPLADSSTNMPAKNATNKQAVDTRPTAQKPVALGDLYRPTHLMLPQQQLPPAAMQQPMQPPAPAPSQPEKVFALNADRTKRVMRGSQARAASATTPSGATSSQGEPPVAATASNISIGDISVDPTHFIHMSPDQAKEEYRMIRAYAGRLMPELMKHQFPGNGWIRGADDGMRLTREGHVILSYYFEFRGNTTVPDEDAINWIFMLGGILMLKPRPAYVFEKTHHGLRSGGLTAFGESNPELVFLEDDGIRSKRPKVADYVQFQEMHTERHIRQLHQCKTRTIWFEANGSYDFLKDGKAVERFIPIYEDFVHSFSVPFKIIGRVTTIDALQGACFIEKEKGEYRRKHAEKVVRDRIEELRQEQEREDEKREAAERRAAAARHRRQVRQDRKDRQNQQQLGGGRPASPSRYEDDRHRGRQEPRSPPRQRGNAGVRPVEQDRRRGEISEAAQRRVPEPQNPGARQGVVAQQRPLPPPSRQMKSEIYVDYGDGPVAPAVRKFELHPGTKRKATSAENPRDKVRPAECGFSTLAKYVKKNTELEDDEAEKENRGEDEDEEEQEDDD